MEVKIVSGLSGAGKSTWLKAQSWFENAAIHSADSFFMKDGKYQFDATKLDEAHGECLRGFIRGCRAGWRSKEAGPIIEEGNASLVEVVDNTNLTVEEIAPYYSVARAYGYDVELITLHIDVYTAAERNSHGVSLRAIESMYKKLYDRRLPHFWKMVKSNYRWTEQGWSKL